MKRKHVFQTVLVVFIVLIMANSVFAKTNVVTGRFNSKGWTNYTTVYTEGKTILNFYINSPVKIKICTFDRMGWWTSGKYDIQIKLPSGQLYTYYNIASGKVLTLKRGYWKYEIRIRRHSFPNDIWGTDFMNLGKCYYWSVDAIKNCSF